MSEQITWESVRMAGIGTRSMAASRAGERCRRKGRARFVSSAVARRAEDVAHCNRSQCEPESQLGAEHVRGSRSIVVWETTDLGIGLHHGWHRSLQMTPVVPGRRRQSMMRRLGIYLVLLGFDNRSNNSLSATLAGTTPKISARSARRFSMSKSPIMSLTSISCATAKPFIVSSRMIRSNP